MQADDPAMEQYSLTKILAIWAAASVPMPVSAFWGAPFVSEAFGLNPGMTLWAGMICGMIWQFLLSVIILRRELLDFTWSEFRARIWLQAPRDPVTGATRYRLFWWLIPALLFYAAFELTPAGPFLGQLILIPLPFLFDLSQPDLAELAVPENIGNLWLIVFAIVSFAFNYVLGEELLFRGILLPRMRGVFGRWDWLANAVLFGAYHLHKPFVIIPTAIAGIAWSLPSRHFRSIWFAVILHGIEGIVVLVVVAGIVTGLAFP